VRSRTIFVAWQAVWSYIGFVSIKSSGAIRSATESDPTTVPRRCGSKTAENQPKTSKIEDLH
jgi:hypothetical protein